MTPIYRIVLVCLLSSLVSSVAIGGTPEPDPQPRRVRLFFGGDVMFGRYINRRLVRHSDKDPFAAMKPLIKQASFAFLNFENPVCRHTPEDLLKERSRWTIRLAALPSDVALVADAGFDLAVLANNHSYDCGREGLVAAIEEMERVGVATAGVSLDADPFAATLIEKEEARVRILALTSFTNRNPGGEHLVAKMNTRRMRKKLARKVRSTRDEDPGALIVVSIHWGPENKTRPIERQRRIAHDLIDAGAHVIMGHHTHVYHPVEVYRGGLILYSLGNLLFDQTSRLQREAGVVSVEFSAPPKQGSGAWILENFTIHPFFREPGSGGPGPASPARAKRFLRRIKNLSRSMYRTELTMGPSGLVWRRSP